MKKISQRYEDAPVADLKVHPRNAKRGAVDVIRRSVDEIGFYGAIVVQRSTGFVLAGNHRFKAAVAEGAETVPVIYVDVDDETALKILLVDNRSAELGETDDALLLELLREVPPEDLPVTGYTADDLDALLRAVGPPPELEPQYEDDDAPPLRPDPKSELGKIYELGPHRLVCGDSTDPASWALLMGDERAHLLWSDPPYGVSYEGSQGAAQRDRAAGKPVKKRDPIKNDSLGHEDLAAFLESALRPAFEHLHPGGGTYVAAAAAGPAFGAFAEVMLKLEVWRHTIIWVKDSFAFGRSDYHYRHEPIFFGWKPGGPHQWHGGRKQDTVHNHPRPRKSKDHPTMKPTGLIRRHIENSSQRGEIVLDPFGGSGSTLIASALAERRARLIELEPGYCDVIRRRWTRWAVSRGLEVGPGGLDG